MGSSGTAGQSDVIGVAPCQTLGKGVCWGRRGRQSSSLPSLPAAVEVFVGSARSILLVEDNEDNRIIYATALRYAGFDVVEAVTGPQAIALARERRPALILMDIAIPEIDGWHATAMLKADAETREIPVIAVTAHVLPGDAERSIAAGCDGYLAKPISPATLIAEVDRRLGRSTPSYQPRASQQGREATT